MRNNYVLTGQVGNKAAIRASDCVRFFIYNGSMNKLDYMKLAFDEALTAFKEDEVPVGCIIVKSDKVIARSHNEKEKKKDPTSHAEIECIRKACKKLNKKYLEDCEMYVTLEPCLMCVGAIKEARLKKIYIGAKDHKSGAVVSRETFLSHKDLNKYEFVSYEKEVVSLLRSFFKAKRK